MPGKSLSQHTMIVQLDAMETMIISTSIESMAVHDGIKSVAILEEGRVFDKANDVHTSVSAARS